LEGIEFIKYEDEKLLNEPFYISSFEAGFGVGAIIDVNGTLLVPPRCVSCQGKAYRLHEDSIYPWDGFHIEYKKVTESFGTNEQNGKKVFLFDPNQYLGSGSTSTPYPAPINMSWRSGNLLSEQAYAKDLNTMKLISESSKRYNSYSFFPITTNGFIIKKVLECPEITGVSTAFYDQDFTGIGLLPVAVDRTGILSQKTILYPSK
jgi:hypothetical protein